MSAISAAMVKELRERTGLGMMDCKKALTECDGDMEKAIESLRKSSGLKAAKKAGRVASDGLVRIQLSDDGRKAVLVEVNCETDFAARDDNFIGFVNLTLGKVFDSGSTDIQALMDAGLEAEREALVQKIGENISVRRAEVINLEEGAVYGYIHTDSKKAALVALKGGDAELGKDIAMHVVATSPQVVRAEEASEELIAKEKEIYTAQAAESGKPADIVEKMVEGRVKKFLAEISLVDQPFVKDPDTKIAALLKAKGAEVIRFVRYEVGEGIEVQTEDFAEEVRKQLGG
ncbi:MAG: translation elongation factor Ts [Gammaproteobacteria bacterium]|nr:translation elongation factor Ts [Gammaproteobacteria bacterium]